MATIIFYEKPGCINNTKQKEWLTLAGHTVDARNILESTFTTTDLRKYFEDKPVKDWFNYTAPAIKNGDLSVDNLSGTDALTLMIESPILIKRPLIQIDNTFMSGFDKERLDKLIGLSATQNAPRVEQLASENLTLCPKLNEPQSCDDLPN